MKQVFLTTLLFLLPLLGTDIIQGMPTSRRGHCLCRGTDVASVRVQRIAQVEYHLPSASCDREELIVTFKRDGKRKCLNVNLDQGRRIKEAILKKRK